MPNIRTYEAGDTGFRPSETGAEAFNRAGMRIEEMNAKGAQAIGSGIKSLASAGQDINTVVEKQQTLHEVTQGAAQSAAFLADKTKEWNDTINAPGFDINNIDTARQQFMDKFQQDASQFQGAFKTAGGQEFAANHMASLTDHFNAKTMGDVSMAAGAALKQNWTQTVDNLATTLHNDPSSLDQVRSMLKPSVDAVVANAHNLTAEDAIAARTSLVQDADRRLTHLGIASAMDHNVQAGLDMLHGKYGAALKPEDIQELENYGKAVTRANRSDALVARSNMEFNQRQASEASANKFLSNLVPKDANGNAIMTGPVTVPDDAYASVLRDPAMKPSEKMTVFQFMDRVQKEATRDTTPKNDPTVAADLMSRLGASENPTSRDDITKAVQDGTLTFQAGMDLLNKAADPTGGMAKLAADPLVKNGFDAAQARIDNGTAAIGLGPNDAVKEASANFRVDTLRILQTAVQHGENIDKYLNPNDPAYLFDQKRIDQYRPSKDEIKNNLLAPRTALGAAKAKSAEEDRAPLSDILSKALNFNPRGPAAPLTLDSPGVQ